MEEQEEIVEVPAEILEETPKKPSGKGAMTEKKLDNLKKAREAKKKNLDLKKYSQDKRPAAEERIEEELNKRAELLAEKKAEELIEKRKQEAELKEYCAWKKEQEAPKPVKKPVKVVKKKKKVVVESSDESDESEDEPVKKKKATKKTSNPREFKEFFEEEPVPTMTWLDAFLD